MKTMLKNIFYFSVFAILSLNASWAQPWPTKQPIKIIVPYPAGGAADVTARILAVKLGIAINQSVVVENRAGANGVIGLDYVAKSMPDGYTLLATNLSSHGTGPAVSRKLPYDPINDFSPIMLTSLVPMVLVTRPNFPAKSISELIAYAKSNPGKVTIASAGNGSSNHLASELLNSMAGIKMLHVPYKGDTPAMLDVMSGTVDVMLPSIVAATPHLKSGKLKAIAMGGASRSPYWPDLPTISESGVNGYVGATWGGLLAPAGTPNEIIAKLNTEITRILRSQEVQTQLAGLGAEINPTSPEEFKRFLRSEIDKWTKVAAVNNIVID